MHRPRRGAAQLNAPRQAWVPRVLNLTLAGFLLLFLVPMVLHLSELSLSVQVFLVVLAIPLGFLCLACLASAIRPGSLGGLVRRRR
ncbi:MAG: hypothetical protein JWO22_1140 [Frankiales bacterium]|nr:hypothetical protein [Frankiales bacterium]